MAGDGGVARSKLVVIEGGLSCFSGEGKGTNGAVVLDKPPWTAGLTRVAAQWHGGKLR
jgi:hypothetical protein